MNVEIIHRPASAAARLGLASGETCTAEAGAMIAMSGGVTITTSTHKKGGGLLRAAGRMLAGESFFLNHYAAGPGGGEVWLSAPLPGDMMTYPLANERLVVQAGSFVACEPGVKVDVGWQGFKTLFSGESLFWLHLSGAGQVVLHSFGAIYPIDVDGEHVVDTGHIVAFNETLEFSLTKAGKSWVASILGGEGLVCRFRGRGRVWCQSHNPKSFGSALGSLLKPR